MDENDMIDEEEYEFSRNYFLAKESRKSVKKSSAHKVSEINLADEQEPRAEVSNIEPKHEKEIALLINSYKRLYNEWVFELSWRVSSGIAKDLLKGVVDELLAYTEKSVTPTLPCLKDLTLNGIDYGSVIMVSCAIDLICCSPDLEDLSISGTSKNVVLPPEDHTTEVDCSRIRQLGQLRKVLFAFC